MTQKKAEDPAKGKSPSQSVNPLEHASWFGIISVWFMQSTMMLGSVKPLDVDDIFPLPSNENPGYVMKLFEMEWARRKQINAKVSTLRTVLSVWGGRLMMSGFLEFGFYLAQMFIPFFISAITTFLQSDDRQYWGKWSYGVWYALGLYVCSITSSISINNKFYHVTRAAMRMRSALMTAIYAKSLRLSSASRQGSTTGETINLMSGDASRVFEMMIFVNTLWVSPCVIAIVLGLMYWQIGYSALTAVVLMTLLLPIQYLMAQKIGKTRRSMLKHTDERVKMMSEILQGIRVIKLYAWEIPMHKKIASVRELEVAQLWLSTYLKQINQVVMFVWPALVTFCTFVTYSLLGNEVKYQTVFIVLAFLNVLRFPISLLPTAINSTSEALISFRRLDHFFALSELQNWEQKQRKDAIFAKLNKITREIEGKEQHGVIHKTGSKQSLISSSIDESSLTSEEVDLLHKIGTIYVNHGEFRWDPKSEKPTLSNIALDVEAGSLVGIIGQVGSGKSSLISAILGEMSYHPQGTDIAVNGCVSYMSQKPWVRNTTVKNNILFGLPYNEKFYRRCLHAAALLPDLAILPAGDETEIGEQGLNLSGGQKARVSMARSLYRAHLSDIFIMDDPFSAVDMTVGKHMFENGVMTMLKGKTRLVVLNSHLHFLKEFDKIIVLDAMENENTGGRIIAQGTYAQISAQYGELMRVMEAQSQLSAKSVMSDDEHKTSYHTLNQTQGDETKQEQQETHVTLGESTRDVYSEGSEMMIDPSPAAPVIHTSPSPAPSPSPEPTVGSTAGGSEKSIHLSQQNVIPAHPPAQNNGTLMSTEDRSIGAVKWSVYQQYFAAAVGGFGTFVLCAIVALFLTSQCARLGSDVWVTYWGRDSDNVHSTLWWIISYLIWVCTTFFLALFRSWVFASISVRASQKLHDHLFERLLRAPVTTFFDTTPVGRIINRFSKDLDQVDTILPDYLSQLLQFTFQLGSAVILACVATPYFLAVLGPVFVLFVWIQGYYRRSSRELKRLEGSTRSPIFSSFGETLTGLSTVRAYGMVHDMIKENQHAVDQNGKIFLASQFAERWLSVRLEMCASTIIGGIAILAVTVPGISPSIAGLAIVYVLQLGGLLQWTVRVSIQVESTMTSVERLTTYSEMTTEAAPHIPDALPPSTWPSKGVIEFDKVEMRYRPELDLVLKGISCQVKPNEKIGICGRTGSGKSSLMVALFRLVELASGTIRIDGVDISKIGLADLRSKLSIIPQDPVLFSGTVRKNLDPFENHTDKSVWQALERVSLASVIRGLDGQLSHAVAENGDNFSHGQRQLICIARALLRKSKILIMDEATAAVDSETDKLIQATIRLNFDDCTVLTIAHRLDTIIDADRILVLSGGNIVEFDTPLALLQRPSSAFRTMVSEGGAAVVASLTKMAQEADDVRRLVSSQQPTQQSRDVDAHVINVSHQASDTTDEDSRHDEPSKSSMSVMEVVFHE